MFLQVSSRIIDYVYTTWATPSQKCKMRQEFYGKIFEHSKDKTVVSLKDGLNIFPDIAAGLLAATKSNLVKVLGKYVSFYKKCESQFIGVSEFEAKVVYSCLYIQ